MPRDVDGERPSTETIGDVTRLLHAVGRGEHDARTLLIDLVYDELKALAHQRLRGERRDHTLQTTALVHEAYLHLVAQRSVSWANRGQFFGIAALAMRRILIDDARARRRSKRGGDLQRVPLDDMLATWSPLQVDRLLWIDEKLTKLQAMAPRQYQVVQLRFFGGLTEEEVADVLQVSTKTVKRDWCAARAWLAADV